MRHIWTSLSFKYLLSPDSCLLSLEYDDDDLGHRVRARPMAEFKNSGRGKPTISDITLAMKEDGQEGIPDICVYMNLLSMEFQRDSDFTR